jgi:hypothetical protein
MTTVCRAGYIAATRTLLLGRQCICNRLRNVAIHRLT